MFQLAPLDLIRTTTHDTGVTASAKPNQGRRLSWREFYVLRPDLQPANDNEYHNKQDIVA